MSQECNLTTSQSGTVLCLHFSGSWTTHIKKCNLPDFTTLLSNKFTTLSYNTDALTEWDSRMLVELTHITEIAASKSITIDEQGLPLGIQKLLQLTRKKVLTPPRNHTIHPGFFEWVGNHSISFFQSGMEMVLFTGKISLSYLRFCTGKARFLKRDFIYFLYDCGPLALPIVTLIAFLVGFTLAFIGAVQLQMFGADIYVANLVGLTMTREMGAMMAAIIMAGRTGAAYAAQLGAMQVNEEVDALQTMGLNAFDFLVLPRMTAMIIMMPMLTVWADFMGILGGFFIGCLSLDISPILYYEQTIKAIHLNHFLVGIIKSVFFGYIVAFCGCLKGMNCGRSADAVGKATTSAVVTAIVFIVVADALFTFFFNLIGI
jgi:phospholipid/cholesterol/gamma-HCH transport system permease protein